MSLSVEKEKFILVCKRILKKRLSTNTETLNTYKNDLIITYNSSIRYVKQKYPNAIPSKIKTYDEYLEYLTVKVKACATKLKYSFLPPNEIFQEITNDNFVTKLDSDSNQDNSSDTENYSEDDQNSNQNSNNSDNPNNMTEEAQSKFINTYSKIIPEFDGSAENFTRFTDACELLNENVGQFMPTAIRLVKTKLIGSARSYITTENTIEAILRVLKNNITGESSKVVSAKLMSLKQTNKTSNDYIKELESLTKSLKRSYLDEGLPPANAESLANDCAVKAIIYNTHDEKTKTIMQAADFKSLNEASTKFLTVSTERDNLKSQILFYKKKFSPRGRGSFNGSRGSYRNNNRGNGNVNNYDTRTYRGRGSHRGNRGRGQVQNVRYTENSHGPQQALGGRTESSE